MSPLNKRRELWGQMVWVWKRVWSPKIGTFSKNWPHPNHFKKAGHPNLAILEPKNDRKSVCSAIKSGPRAVKTAQTIQRRWETTQSITIITKMIKNWLKTVQNGPKMGQNWAKNDQKQLNEKWSEVVRSGQKWSEMVRNDQNNPKWSKNDQKMIQKSSKNDQKMIKNWLKID